MYAFQRRKRQSTSVFWSGKAQAQRRLTGHRPCSHKALDMDQRLSHPPQRKQQDFGPWCQQQSSSHHWCQSYWVRGMNVLHIKAHRGVSLPTDRNTKVCHTYIAILMCLLSRFSRVWVFATPWTAAHQAPLSMGFSRQEYWSGLPFPSPGIFSTQGSNPSLLHCRQILYHWAGRGNPIRWEYFKS